MTFRERERRIARLKHEVQSARARLRTALLSKEYEVALVCQMEIDHLRVHARRLAPRHGHDLFPPWDEIA
jgi:hypothetical protein